MSKFTESSKIYVLFPSIILSFTMQPASKTTDSDEHLDNSSAKMEGEKENTKKNKNE
jgi:hypothetical protein